MAETQGRDFRFYPLSLRWEKRDTPGSQPQGCPLSLLIDQVLPLFPVILGKEMSWQVIPELQRPLKVLICDV